MNSQNICSQPACNVGPVQESRSQRFNLPVTHPSRWALIRDVFFSAPNHTRRYRALSQQMLKKTVKQLNRQDCE
ncbi:MAG TPA: hypothetical protein PKH39_14710 [Woeseiaceae bacterium]|nr:hypothetical protein [Woeseiaceae bacterium]